MGQQSPTVWVYSFLPQEGVEKIIRLRARCAQRLRENARAFESDERFFDSPDELDATIRGLFDGTADLSANEDATLVDWSSHAMAIWDQASDIDRTRAASLPDVVYSTRAVGEAVGPGALVYARTALGMDAIAWTDPKGDVRALDPFQALTVSRVDPGIPALERRPDHHRLVKTAIERQLLDAVRSSNVVALSGVQRMDAHFSDRPARCTASAMNGSTRGMTVTIDQRCTIRHAVCMAASAMPTTGTSLISRHA